MPRTQNANEYLSGLIWKHCPKVGNHDLRTVNISVALAVSTLNGGLIALGTVLEEMGLHMGIFSSNYFVAKECARIKNTQRQASRATHKARRAKRRKRLCLDEQQEEAVGFLYVSGGH